MTLMREDHVDIGVLVAWALRPNQRPGRSPEYQRVLDRYRTVAEFRAAADAVLHGLGAQVLSDGDFGLVLGVVPESPLAFRVTDMQGLYKSDQKVVAGLILTGLAAFAYPSAQELDEDRLRPVAVADFEAWLRDLCERLRSHDAGGEVIPEEGLDAAWRIYLAMPAQHLSETGRLTNKCTRYWIRQLLTWLTGQGMARPDPLADDTWTLTERFRIHAREIALERAYSFIAGRPAGLVPPGLTREASRDLQARRAALPLGGGAVRAVPGPHAHVHGPGGRRERAAGLCHLAA
jgi:hypothetical protein